MEFHRHQPRLPPLALLRSFEVAARHLSFKDAATELHVTPAAISQQIKALEAHIGRPLFERLTRALRLSACGAALLPAVQQGLGLLAGAVDQARMGAEVESQLWLTAPPSLASRWLLPRLPDFEARHSGLSVRLASTPEAVGLDGAAALLTQASGPGISALAILYGPSPCQGLRMDPLLRPEYLPVCTPAVAEGPPALRKPADLLAQVLIHDDTLAEAGRASNPWPWGWPQWLRAAGVRWPAARSPQACVGVPGRRFSNAALALDAAFAGQGVALVARPLVDAALQAGTLVAPFALSLPSPFAYFLACDPAIAQRPGVQALRQWLLAQATSDGQDGRGEH